MRVKDIIYEDFANYKEPCMFIGTCFCDFKCCKESNVPISVCQNSALENEDILEVNDLIIIEKYLQNDLTKAVVFGGLEPFKQFEELLTFCATFRLFSSDPIIIYTGYYPEEITIEISALKLFPNIIIKFGRFIPNDTSHFDEVLGITLISSNQWAEKIST